jgi:hypothetical protein
MSEFDKPVPLEGKQSAASQRDAYLAQLQEVLVNPLHKRLIAAYQKGNEPVSSMEAELGSAMNEILAHED